MSRRHCARFQGIKAHYQRWITGVAGGSIPRDQFVPYRHGES